MTFYVKNKKSTNRVEEKQPVLHREELSKTTLPTHTGDPSIVCIAAPPPSIDAIRMVSTGRGSLAFALGDKECRFRLFSREIHWDRVIVAKTGSVLTGFLAFQHHCRGPYQPKLKHFIEVFGWSACWRYLIFWWLEARTWQHEFYVYGLRVEKQFRRAGVANSLLLSAEEHARSLGIECISLEVFASNQRAINLYMRHGYTVRTARQLHWWRSPEDSETIWLMEKRLSC